MRKIYIGTSGWAYPHWKSNFYPQDLVQSKWLEYYSKQFNSVEVNFSFYRQPKASTFEKWASETPENFAFSIKGNRFITHIKRIKDCQEPLKRFFESADVLVAKRPRARDVILWQLPPSLKKDVPRLEGFLKLIPKSFRHAFEFRHESWLDEEVLDLINNHETVETAVVIQDWHDWPIIKKPIGDFVYLRFHGKKQLYSSNYSKEDLEEWAKKMREWSSRKLDIYAYFNNDALGHAPRNASQLKKLIT